MNLLGATARDNHSGVYLTWLPWVTLHHLAKTQLVECHLTNI